MEALFGPSYRPCLGFSYLFPNSHRLTSIALTSSSADLLPHFISPTLPSVTMTSDGSTYPLTEEKDEVKSTAGEAGSPGRSLYMKKRSRVDAPSTPGDITAHAARRSSKRLAATHIGAASGSETQDRAASGSGTQDGDASGSGTQDGAATSSGTQDGAAYDPFPDISYGTFWISDGTPSDAGSSDSWMDDFGFDKAEDEGPVDCTDEDPAARRRSKRIAEIESAKKLAATQVGAASGSGTQDGAASGRRNQEGVASGSRSAAGERWSKFIAEQRKLLRRRLPDETVIARIDAKIAKCRAKINDLIDEIQELERQKP